VVDSESSGNRNYAAEYEEIEGNSDQAFHPTRKRFCGALAMTSLGRKPRGQNSRQRDGNVSLLPLVFASGKV
jgi:hypothetical protein